MQKLLLIVFINIVFSVQLFSQLPYNNRYLSAVFDSITVDTNVVYGTAPALAFPYLNEGNTVSEDLLVDIYQPYGDTLNKRPLIICAHSGSFLSGSKTNDDMVDFCDSLAHRGYVAASIDYRLGMNILSASSSIRAVYRGLQDGRAAVRFFKEYADLYHVDTNQIYMLGSSAGSFIALHNMFMDTEEERPPESYTTPDLGCLDCSGNSYQHSGKANAVTALWGGIEDTSLIITTDSLPLFLAHGTADDVVYFDVGSPFSYPIFPEAYGSWPVSLQRENFTHPAETYFVEGAGHEFYGADNGMWGPMGPNAYWDTIFNKADTFFYNVHKPYAAFTSQGFENVYTFFDESNGATEWHWDFGDSTYSNEQNPVHEFLKGGRYKVTQMVLNPLTSWDTTSAFIDIFVSVKEVKQSAVTVWPNPVKNKLNLSEDFDFGYILDSEGKTIKKFCQTKQLDVNSLPPAIYFVSLISGNKRQVIRIIKQTRR
jgi:hypothetical protein